MPRRLEAEGHYHSVVVVWTGRDHTRPSRTCVISRGFDDGTPGKSAALRCCGPSDRGLPRDARDV